MLFDGYIGRFSSGRAINLQMHSRIKIYGERNSGTNYLAALLARNLPVILLPGVAPDSCPDEESRDRWFDSRLADTLGWKHGSPPDFTALGHGGVVFVVIFKNPFAWLLSLHRRPYHCFEEPTCFRRFLRRPWCATRRDRGPTHYRNPADMWNRKSITWLALRESTHRALMLRYEDLLLDPEDALRVIAAAAGVPQPSSFEPVHESTKRNGKTYAECRDYYLNERWRTEWSQEDYDYVSGELNASLVNALGYDGI